MRSPRFILMFATAFVKRFKFQLLGFVVLALVAPYLVKIASSLFLDSPDEYVGVVGKYRIEEIPTSITSKLSSGLVKIGSNGVPEPALASSWEAQDNGKKWIFKLKNNIYWQDKNLINSWDINYAFDGVNIERPDRETLTFSLSDPYAPFPLVLTRPLFKKGLLGLGVYKVDSITFQGLFVDTLQISGENKKILYKFFPNEQSAVTGFKMGHIDKILEVNNPSDLDSWKNVEIKGVNVESRYVAVFFNHANAPFKDNKPLRQALSYAIDKDKLGKRVIGPIPSSSWSFNDQIKPYAFDLFRSEELINSIRKNKTDKIEFTLHAMPGLLETAEKIVRDWEKIGVKAEIKVANDLPPDDFQAYLAMYDVSLDPDQYLTWHSTQSETNISNYTNPRIDKLLEDGRLEMNLDKRKKLAFDFQRFLLEDAAAIFLFQPSVYTITRL